MVGLAALLAALAYAAERTWHAYLDYLHNATSEPPGPRCKECLRCASCRREMSEDGTPRASLRTVPRRD